MSEFENLINAGFSEAVGQMGAPFTHGGVTTNVIANRIVRSKFLREHGYLPDFETEMELPAADFDQMNISDRTVVEFAGSTFIVVGIARDSADPMVALMLKAAK